jgi:hypothetical protein
VGWRISHNMHNTNGGGVVACHRMRAAWLPLLWWCRAYDEPRVPRVMLSREAPVKRAATECLC